MDRPHFLECEISRHESFLRPGNNIKDRICRFIRRQFQISETGRASKLYLRSTAAITRERRRQRDEPRYRYIIHPYSTMRLFWTSFITCLTAFSLYELPLRNSFNYLVDNRIGNLAWMFFGLIIDLIYIINIPIQFISGYVSRFDKEIILEPRRIARNYLKYNFVVDIISSVPMDVIYYASMTGVSTTVHDDFPITFLIINSFHLFKVLKIVPIRQYLLDIGQVYGIDRYHLYRIFMLYTSLLVFHWLSCCQHLLPVVKMYISDEMHSKSWITLHKLWDKPIYYRYIYSLYRGSSLGLGLSFHTKPPETVGDTILAIATRVIGALAYAIIISHYVHVYDVIYREHYETADKMKIQLKSYMNHKQLPKDIQKKVIDYFNFHYADAYCKERQIVQALSTPMLEAIRTHQAVKIAENTPLFHRVPFKLLRNIVSKMTCERFSPSDVIIRANSAGDSMYFLFKGAVAVYTSTGKEICHLHDGEFFGEISLLMGIKRVATVIAIEHCETFRLYKADLEDVIDTNSEIWSELKTEAERRQHYLHELEMQIQRNRQRNVHKNKAKKNIVEFKLLKSPDEDNYEF